MDNIKNVLDSRLLSQTFETSLNPAIHLTEAKFIAQMYARLENCISVLSDMRARKSYLYYGPLAGQLGLQKREAEIASIWEDELLSRVHTEDLQKKYRLEFHFFEFLSTINIYERADYEVLTRLRVKNKEGDYILLKHRLVYLTSTEDGTIWLALCLYNMIYEHPEVNVPEGVIVNNKSGRIVDYNPDRINQLLSPREVEILHLIKHGRRSKEIADKLSLSVNTINRHRQNIFQKLNVTNALEACRIAENAGLL